MKHSSLFGKCLRIYVMAKPLFNSAEQYWTTQWRSEKLQEIADGRLITKAALHREIEGLYLQHCGVASSPPRSNGHAEHRETA